MLKSETNEINLVKKTVRLFLSYDPPTSISYRMGLGQRDLCLK